MRLYLSHPSQRKSVVLNPHKKKPAIAFSATTGYEKIFSLF
jgi:hypothetical protein